MTLGLKVRTGYLTCESPNAQLAISFPKVNNSYDKHFGVKPVALTDSAKSDIERRDLKSSRESLGRLGKAVIAIPQSSQERTAVKLGESDVSNTKTSDYRCSHILRLGPGTAVETLQGATSKATSRYA